MVGGGPGGGDAGGGAPIGAGRGQDGPLSGEEDGWGGAGDWRGDAFGVQGGKGHVGHWVVFCATGAASDASAGR